MVDTRVVFCDLVCIGIVLDWFCIVANGISCPLILIFSSHSDWPLPVPSCYRYSALYSRTSHSNKKVRTRTRTRKLNIETQTQVQVQLHKDNKSDNQSSITITKPKQEVTVMATRAEKSETEMKSVSSIFNAHMQLHTDHRMEPNPDHSPNWHQPCHSVLAYSMGWGFTPKSHSLFVE